MAELNNTIVKGNLRVTSQAEIQEVIENGTSLANKYYLASNPNGYTSNTGTVTSVAVSMNGTSKGTVTTSGTIDLGTVITDISQSTLTTNLGLGSVNNNPQWGTLTSANGYTTRWGADQTGGGGIIIAEKDGQTSMQVDGDIYVNEGTYKLATQNWVSSQGYAMASDLNNYLPLAGGTLTGASDAPLVIKSAANYTGSYIQFKNGSGTTIGYLGVNTIDNNNYPVFYDNQNHRLAYYSDIPAAVRYDTASQGLTTTQKSNARTNIGAGTSNFTGYTSSNMLSAEYVYDEGSVQTVATAFEDIYGMIDGINVVLEEIPTHLYEHTITIEAPYCYTIDGTNFNNVEIMLTFSLISIHSGTITGNSNSLAAFLWNIDDAGEAGDYHATGYMSTVEGSEGWSDFKPSNIAHRISIFVSDFYEDIALRVYQGDAEAGFNSWYTFLGADNDDRGTVDITETVRSIY